MEDNQKAYEEFSGFFTESARVLRKIDPVEEDLDVLNIRNAVINYGRIFDRAYNGATNDVKLNLTMQELNTWKNIMRPHILDILRPPHDYFAKPECNVDVIITSMSNNAARVDITGIFRAITNGKVQLAFEDVRQLKLNFIMIAKRCFVEYGSCFTDTLLRYRPLSDHVSNNIDEIIGAAEGILTGMNIDPKKASTLSHVGDTIKEMIDNQGASGSMNPLEGGNISKMMTGILNNPGMKNLLREFSVESDPTRDSDIRGTKS